MNPAQLEQIVNAVLYEGYILYPYRSSSKKNQRERFTFGRVYPEAYSVSQKGAEPCVIQTECLIIVKADEATLNVSLRFLQPMAREVGKLIEPLRRWPQVEPEFQVVPELRVGNELFQTWQEAVERRVDSPSLRLDLLESNSPQVPFGFPSTRTVEPLTSSQSEIVGVIVRRQAAIEGRLEIAARRLDSRLYRITVRVLNKTEGPDDQETVLLRTFASAHAILGVQGSEFVSLLDPGAQYQEAAQACQNLGTWPVLVGEEQEGGRDTMLSSPIILYDYPKIAPESAGPLFDGTEIDEILTLRILTMTEGEKLEMGKVDEHARRLLERTGSLEPEALLKMHGAMRPGGNQPATEFDDFFGASTPLKGVSVAEAWLKAGDRVRLRPKGRADVMDLALEGQTAIIEAVEQDLEKRVHVAVVLENDPGKDLGLMRQPGHRFFYAADEVEPLQEEAR